MAKARKALKSSLSSPSGSGQLEMPGFGQAKAPERLDEQLVLRDFVVSLLGASSFLRMKQMLASDDLEGQNEEGTSRILVELLNRIPESKRHISEAQLLEYDENILRHTRKISEARETHGSVPLVWKYFQYLSLLFTEIYLHRYFENEAGFLVELNSFLSEFNKNKGSNLQEIKPEELNKLAIWQATGSGKTLLMHLNLLQMQHYLVRYPAKARSFGKILLITPNEGLSEQHLEEFRLSGIKAQRFNTRSQSSINFGQQMEVLVTESSKLGEETKEKTVAYTSLMSNNILLVDEGHKDLGGETRRKMRTALASLGFTFEYSATFSQAIKAVSDKNERERLIQEYARCIIFDYSYKYFHGDGYGKDFTILNLEQDEDIEARHKYLLGSLLTFYQQLKIYEKHPNQMRTFNLERPLMLFVGGNVNGVRTEQKQKKSDVTDILDFLKAFVNGRLTDTLGLAVNGDLGIKSGGDRDVFPVSTFRFLRETFSNLLVAAKIIQPEIIFQDMLRLLFNCEVAGAELHLVNIKGAQGEIGIRVGDNPYSGVINVGDDAELLKLCESLGYHKLDDGISPSIFSELNDDKSTIHFLIGSRKFTEGWSSYRVSSIGLMNIGKGEGSQIIQLFGRGVRLKGQDMSLKRSTAFDPIIAGEPIPEYISNLETLQVAGVRANYMTEFRNFLKEEGVKAKNDRFLEIKIPVQQRSEVDLSKLMVLQLREGVSFKNDVKEIVLEFNSSLFKVKSILDYYPRVKSETSKEEQSGPQKVINRTTLSPEILAFVDWNFLYQECIRFKNEKAWDHLSISKSALQTILENKNWYEILIPADELEFKEMSRLGRIQSIALALLKKYIERFYYNKRNSFEGDKFELISMQDREERRKKDGKLGNIPVQYLVSLEGTEEWLSYGAEIENMLPNLANEQEYEIEHGPLKFSNQSDHVYWPLISQYEKQVQVSPNALNEGEHQLTLHYQQLVTEKGLKGNSWLMRNMSRGRGIGFFEESGFYPDFIWWLTDSKGNQHITFLDPHGLGRTYGLNDPKIRLAQTIKEEEKSIRERTRKEDFFLHSYVIGPKGTKENIPTLHALEDTKLKEAHVYFQSQEGYLEEIYKSVVGT